MLAGVFVDTRASPSFAEPERAGIPRSGESLPGEAGVSETCAFARADAPGAGVDAAVLEEAKQWIRRAADQGSAEAQFMLGILSLQEADEECARRMLQACQYLDGYFAQRGDEEARQALHVISGTYEEKRRLTAELDRAAVLFRQAAEKGGAAYLLGCLFRDGRGVLPSRAEAARWFRKAAEQGDERAQSALARLAAEGEVRDEPIRLPEGEEDPVELGDLDDPVGSFWATSAELEEARLWVHRAADQGMEEAQVLLGIIRSRQWEMEAVSQYHGAVYGAHRGTEVSRETLEAVQRDLEESGIRAELSEDIDRDTFVKWSFISAMAVTGAYYDVPMGEVQKPGAVRDTFAGLSRESAELGRRMGFDIPDNLVEYNLKVIDTLDPHSTASMQKDMARGHESEVQGLLFDLIDAAEAHGVDIPTYRMVAQKFRK